MTDKISTEQMFRDEFAGRVKTTTLDDLPKLLSELMDRQHDYGTICVALGIAAATTAWACNKHDNGGITGFQAGAVAWEMLRHWGSLYPGECGGRMQDFDDLLHPQYGEKFRTIPKHAFEEARKKALKNLEEKSEFSHPEVVEHWRSLTRGEVPFGLVVAA